MSTHPPVASYVGKSVRWYQIGKKVIERRNWLKHLRWQAVSRALSEDDTILSEKVGQAATAFCDALDITEFPIDQDRSGMFRRMGRWVREKITWGVRFPDYRGRLSLTFDDRLKAWIEDAAESPMGRKALDFAQYHVNEEGRSALFAEAVLNEAHGVLIEAREGESPGAARWEMAAEIHRYVPDSEIRRRHQRWRSSARALSAGGTAAVTTQVFTDDLTKSITLGVALTALAAIVELTISTRTLSGQQIAVREQVRAWLEEALVARLWGNLQWMGDLGKQIEETGRPLPIGDLIMAMARGLVTIRPLDDDAKVFRDVDRLREHALSVSDPELLAFLVRLETALRHKPDTLPHAFRALITSVRERNMLGEAEPGGRPMVTRAYAGD
ncbi:hypothetical protein [Nonomuraea jiangxiensis]|uniref:Uncharacterized protein n=1 Tax=Nonomuraea jiangxiensis TaxID=633440 RepID=A0A1G8MJT3_9ACTN|nr:hypothetical protein [Nonomuraea jiangxiensis]SDI68075.1 hypothetical protein SAMN05421869_106431 [Nonomuraea jiangxiensis]